MFSRLRQIRPDERRDTLAASATLFALMAAHALLETARDALFLASIPASRLPFVYLGVAAASLVVAAVQDRGKGGRGALASWLVLSGVGTLGFRPLVASGTWALYALYVWSAVVVTVSLSRFFVLLGARFTATQAKRVYAVVGSGSVIGAIAGSALASRLATLIPTSWLLAAAGAILLLTALGPLALSAAPATTDSASPTAQKRGLQQHAKAVLAHPYARRVAGLLLLTTVAFTLVDFVFKSEVAARVAQDELGAFFARLYLALNVLSLIAQLALVRWLLRTVGTTRSLLVLPALLTAASAGVAAGGGIAAAVALKGADGSLRHSLHRTASELLFVPMSDRLRLAAKTFIDLAGHRSAQAITSLAILGAVGLGIGTRGLGLAIALISGACVAAAIELRKHYLDVFRTTLADAAEYRPADFEDLTLANFETLLAALNGPDPQRVRAALEIFGEQERAHLIPGLILYHPSPEVLAPALDLLASSGRTDFIPLADRLLNHEYADVRAAALRARMAILPDEALLREKVELSCPVVRATALVGLTSRGYATVADTASYFEEVIQNGSNVAKEALARAIGYGTITEFEDILIRLAENRDHTVLLSVVRSMGLAPTPRFIPSLIRMLGFRPVRSATRRTLQVLGEPAFEALCDALADESTEVGIRQQIPRALLKFDRAEAAAVLQRQLGATVEGAVRYRVLRALGRLATENPSISLNRAQLEQALGRDLNRAFSYIDWRLVLEKHINDAPGRETEAQGLLCRMLLDKEAHATERIFRLLGILSPEQDVHTIYRGLAMQSADIRASSRELLESFLPARFRSAVLALVDDVSDEERIVTSGVLAERAPADYEAVLRTLLDVESSSIRSLAVYHVGELGISRFAPAILAMKAEPDSALDVLVRQSVEWLNPPVPEGAT